MTLSSREHASRRGSPPSLSRSGDQETQEAAPGAGPRRLLHGRGAPGTPGSRRRLLPGANGSAVSATPRALPTDGRGSEASRRCSLRRKQRRKHREWRRVRGQPDKHILDTKKKKRLGRKRIKLKTPALGRLSRDDKTSHRWGENVCKRHI